MAREAVAERPAPAFCRIDLVGEPAVAAERNQANRRHGQQRERHRQLPCQPARHAAHARRVVMQGIAWSPRGSGRFSVKGGVGCRRNQDARCRAVGMSSDRDSVRAFAELTLWRKRGHGKPVRLLVIEGQPGTGREPVPSTSRRAATCSMPRPTAWSACTSRRTTPTTRSCSTGCCRAWTGWNCCAGCAANTASTCR